MTIRLQDDFDTLDPHKTNQNNSVQLGLALYDRLVGVDADGTIVPQLAESWTTTEDSATFVLRQGVTCSDGAPLDAEAVAASLERMGAPETEAPYIGRSVGSAGYTVSFDAEAGTVTVQTAAPFAELLLGMAMPWTAIVCPSGLADPDSLTAGAAGSGPYVLEASERGVSYTLAARDGYEWGPPGYDASAADVPTELVFRVVDNEATTANLLEAGDLDLGYVVGQDAGRLRSSDDYTVGYRLNFGSTYLLYNHRDGRPTADRSVREAIASAIDPDAWNAAANFGQGERAYSFLAQDMQCFDPELEDLAVPYDPEAAAEGAAGVSLKILGFAGHNAGPEYLLEALTDAGFSADLESFDLATYLEQLGGGDWDIAAFPYAPPMPSPSPIITFLSGPTPPDGGNHSAISNAAFDAAVAEAVQASDEEARCAAWSDAQHALIEELDILPLSTVYFEWFGRDVEFGFFASSILDPFSLRLTG